MKRGALVTRITNAVAEATNQTWPEDRHIYKAIRRAVEHAIPKGVLVASLTDAEAAALWEAAHYRLEFAGEGDHSDIVGIHARSLRNGANALKDFPSER